MPNRRFEKPLAQNGVSVHHHHGVVLSQVREKRRHNLVQRASFFIDIADTLEYFNPKTLSKGCGSIGAIVRHNNYSLWFSVLLHQRFDGGFNELLLIVSWDQSSDSYLTVKHAFGRLHQHPRGKFFVDGVMRPA